MNFKATPLKTSISLLLGLGVSYWHYKTAVCFDACSWYPQVERVSIGIAFFILTYGIWSVLQSGGKQISPWKRVLWILGVIIFTIAFIFSVAMVFTLY